ncbi:MAG: hypothetical protein JXB50_06925 [Spirochaetes bacterium]|nr:hypothetical protein [Spirochaetota bacterium]
MKEIIIKKIENKDEFFIAYIKNSVLNASFSVCFTDSILGAIALTDFFKMLKSKYEKETIEFVISDDEINIKNQCLLDEIQEQGGQI